MEIPHPCKEEYKQMTATIDGRHCASCAQIVVDFTRMSTEEIKAYFQRPGTDIPAAVIRATR